MRVLCLQGGHLASSRLLSGARRRTGRRTRTTYSPGSWTPALLSLGQDEEQVWSTAHTKRQLSVARN